MTLLPNLRAWFAAGIISIGASIAVHGEALAISSPAFGNGQPVPAKYAKQSDNVSPPLAISGVPAAAKALALIVDDPDTGHGLWTHWIVWNIDPKTTSFAEGIAPPGAIEGRNSSGDAHYDGPQPPSGTHRYFSHLLVLDAKLPLQAGADRNALERAMAGHVLARAEFHGTYTAAP